MADSFVPPAEVQANAKRGLELRSEHGRGGTEVGVARARDLSNGKGIPLDTISRMNSYFARHEVDKQGEGWGKDSAGYIAWLLWGGDAGWAWAKKILKDEEKKDKAMTTELAYSYAGIIKSEKQDDGTIKVYGKATDDSIDIDQQICDEEWLKEAMPHWFKTGGNIREQHSSIAAGVATDYEHKGDGHYIEALIVDPVSVKKIEAGVLKGFSIGIRSPRVIRDAKAAGGRIVGGQIVEVSVVDRPANSNAKMTIAKAVDGELVEVEQTFQETVTPASIAKTVIKPLGNPGTKVEDMETMNKSEIDVRVEKATSIVNKASGLLEELNKYDEATFNDALEALGSLVAVEAREATEGHDERESIKHLLKAIKHLIHWYRGEVAEGEVENVNVNLLGDEGHIEAEEEIEMAAKGGKKANPFAKDEPAEGGSDDKEEPAKDDAGSKETSDEESDDKTDKEEMCAKCNKSVGKDCKCADKSVLSDPVTESIIEKAVKSARDAVEAELELLKSTTIRLEAERDEALNKAAAGGPVRSGLKTKNSKHDSDELLAKAAEYRVKAAGTEDRFLRTGYLELADDLETKARKA